MLPGSGARLIEPIGIFHGSRLYPYEAPRQGVYAAEGDEGRGEVRLFPGRNYEQALRDLAGFDRIWLLFGFHRLSGPNPGSGDWKPLVRPPRHTRRKIGVFATRAPHRPNGLGLSAVRLTRVDGLTVQVSGADLLDGSPIFDIKPYVPAYDSFPEAAAGWTAGSETGGQTGTEKKTGTEPGQEQSFQVRFEPGARERMKFLKAAAGPDLEPFIRLQLEHDPTDTRRKRVTRWSAGDIPDPGAAADIYVLAYRTWRIRFRVVAGAGRVEVITVTSGYSAAERASPDDPYGDRELHRTFVSRFDPA